MALWLSYTQSVQLDRALIKHFQLFQYFLKNITVNVQETDA